MSLRRHTATIVLSGLSLVLASCAILPGGEPDERWADFRNWTKITEGRVSTGDPTRFIGNVHKGPEGYREVYVNDIGAAMLEGTGPYNFPEGTIIVKEQFDNKAAWEEGGKSGVTVSVKASASDELSADNWIWADSYTGKAGPSQFCAGCHAIAAKDDYAFTNGAFFAKEEAK